MSQNETIININIEDEMKSAYIDYSMSVIVSRALPDVRDGLKPVHRRVLFGMHELNVYHNKAHKKSARIVGEVLGKFHPHGDSSVYDTMVRMAQEWSLRYLMVDGQGNFGSIDGDSPAAMRYTEVRLTKFAEEMLSDIEKETVDHQLNFDDTLEEPVVLPSKVPNLLVNGASGIAVGMATNMAPHNLGEIVDGIIQYIDNNDITCEELLKVVKGPDFPTAGIIYGYEGVKDALLTGRGRIVIRARANIEALDGNRERIIVTEIPYQVNKSDLLIKTAELINDKKIDGISDIRDESDRNGIRVVYEIKRDAQANVVLNHLYKYTSLQSSFSVNNIALVKGRPVALNLLDMIGHFVDHRHEVVVRRTKYDLRKTEERAHILIGYLIALDNLDAVIKLIRESQTPDDAKAGLIAQFSLSDIQAKAILEMRLQRLTGLERDKIKAEYDELMRLITDLQDILERKERRMEIIKNELIEVKAKYGDPRRSEIVYSADDMSMEDLIEEEDVVITISHLGYVKRTPLVEYKKQNRGGKGSMGGSTRDTDFIEHVITASTHSYMLLFTESGKCYWIKAYEIPEGSRTSKGRALQNLISISGDDKVRAYLAVKSLKDEEYINNTFIIFCTKKGTIKKTTLEAYSRPRANGIQAISVTEGDQLIEACLTTGKSEIIMAVQSGRANRFNESKVRAMGRTATGVRGITVDRSNDEVVGMVCVDSLESNILVVSEKGYGKRTDVDEYRITNRGGKGVKTLNITEKTGNLVAIKVVTDKDDLLIINKSGVLIRTGVAELRVMGRATQGVRLIRLKGDDEIASVTCIEHEEDEEEILLDEEGNPIIKEVTEDAENQNKSENETEKDSDSESENNQETNTNEEN